MDALRARAYLDLINGVPAAQRIAMTEAELDPHAGREPGEPDGGSGPGGGDSGGSGPDRADSGGPGDPAGPGGFGPRPS